MISIFEYSPTQGILERDISKLGEWDKHCDSILWVDLENESEENLMKVLNEQFKFHPLAIEDTVKYMNENAKYHLPKVEDFDDYIFIIFNSIIQTGEVKFKVTPLSCFLGKNFLLTVHRDNLAVNISKRLKDGFLKYAIKKGVDYLLHMIFDDIVDRYYPILDNFENKIDRVQDNIFKKSPGNRTLLEIINLKKELVELRRIAFYQKEVLFKIIRGDFDLITEEESIYYRNVYDHLVRVADSAEAYRDLISGLMDSYLSVVNNRLTEITKALAVIATIFLPLNLIAGVYGMNFEFIPLIFHPYGFWIIVCSMLLIATSIFFYFKRKRLVTSKDFS
ncbi:MAG TPA: magnesium/cobalt transporter CorA [Ignavibacteria bacterium]|nr:magnesium/cobalt transporter CorA [Ignavibacteria bacterium]